MDYAELSNRWIFSPDCEWEDGSYVKIHQSAKTAVRICANRAGLITLANHLMMLANCAESSIIYEPWPGDLEYGSLDLEIQRVDCEGRKTEDDSAS